MIDNPPLAMKASQLLYFGHGILLIPLTSFMSDDIKARSIPFVPTLTLCADDLLEEVSERSREIGFALPAAAISSLSDESLKEHWRAIPRHFSPELPYLGKEPTLTKHLEFAAVDLPRRWIARQLGVDGDPQQNADAKLAETIGQALITQAYLAATARLEREDREQAEAEGLLIPTVLDERHKMKFPVTIAVPGVAPAYIRNAYGATARDRMVPKNREPADSWVPDYTGESDAIVEHAAINFVTTHQSLAQSGVGIVLPAISPEAFVVLAKLERHFEQRTQNGPAVWKMLDKLNAIGAPILSEAVVTTIGRASSLTVFSNFPVGLLRLPGDTSPLLTRVPIAYRPLLPLTRTVQKQLAYIPPIELTQGLRVLVCECISIDDRIGPESRSGWAVAAERVNSEQPRIAMKIVETSSVRAMRDAIASYEPHILVISAHGVLLRENNVAGIQVGDQVWLGDGVGTLPPVVILSACSVAPRGAGTVSITDLLLREGAVAVLGTQVPVDVYRNAILMSRFFVYIAEVLASRVNHLTLLEVWQHTQTSNAVFDVLSGSPSLHAWGRDRNDNQQSVVAEFMGTRSVGRLRAGRIYADTEDVLAEIAEDRGIGDRVRNWFRRPGYVPESLFYIFAGCPDRIYLQPLSEKVRESVS
ncbi:CHAT domain-containing protein [Catellatospora paridis]|uniref:CHAT domain-containing protein n=1 Tax=Catellatospora paridis TaxID=1617086 RepID=UPI0018AF81B0|nr:CHAT domain-containing protein [Catellatospora paridis]